MSSKIFSLPRSTTGLYLHIPFCEKKCGYCDFYSLEKAQHLKDPFLRKVISEIEFWQQGAIKVHGDSTLIEPFPDRTIDSIYFGGGTPSLLEIEEIEGILAKFALLSNFQKLQSSSWSKDSDIEISLEVNPESVDERYLLTLASLGINKITFGVQSFHEKGLKILNRLGSPEQSIAALNWARKAGFPTLSADLIFGWPGQRADMLLEDLKRLLDLGVNHLSCYQLSVDKKHPLYTTLPDDSALRGMYDLIQEELVVKRRWLHYEVSNYAKEEEFKSRHNQKYWQMQDYLGFGAAAWSRLGNVSFTNARNLMEYLQKDFSVSEDIANLYTVETLSLKDLLTEFFIGALRTEEGFSLNNPFYQTFLDSLPNDEMWQKTLFDFFGQGWLHQQGERIKVSYSGMLYYDSMLQAIYEIIS